MPQAKEKEFDQADVMILNTLRCEPPTLRFNFFEYAGLQKSVFRLLSDIRHNGFGSLDEIIEGKNCQIVNIPSSQDPHSNGHMVMYNSKPGGISTIIVNAYNNFSGERDAKMVGRAKIKGTDGKDYYATLIAIEVYRGKGNLRPVWGVGLYISPTDPQSSEERCLYEESFFYDLPRVADRSFFNRPIAAFLDRGLSQIVYDPSLDGVTLHKPKYLSGILDKNKGVERVSEMTFEANAHKWFRYLLGTLDVRKVIKIEDRYALHGNPTKYRVELISTHLTNESGEYLVERLEDGHSLKDGPFSHEQAWQHFIQSGNDYARRMCLNAGKPILPFSISIDWRRIDFEYATAVADASNKPIVLTSWSSPFDQEGIKLDQERHYYFQFWNGSPDPLRFEVGNFGKKDLQDPNHPKAVMRRITESVPFITYGDGSQFINDLRRNCVLLE
jgi:hypothetical protein